MASYTSLPRHVRHHSEASSSQQTLRDSTYSSSLQYSPKTESYALLGLPSPGMGKTPMSTPPASAALGGRFDENVTGTAKYVHFLSTFYLSFDLFHQIPEPLLLVPRRGDRDPHVASHSIMDIFFDHHKQPRSALSSYGGQGSRPYPISDHDGHPPGVLHFGDSRRVSWPVVIHCMLI